jgi:EAL domain-containing protein (putative c-di-GMP-specific phosphodiesterase class I)
MSTRAEPLTELLVSLADGESASTLVDLAVDAARRHLGMDLSLLSEFHAGHQVYRRVSGDGEAFGVQPGTGPRLEDTYCSRVVDGVLSSVVPDTAQHPITAGLKITAAAGIGAYVGVPVHLPDGELYGTLCCLNHDADPDLRERDARFLEVLAAILGEEIGRERAGARRRRSLRVRIDDLLRDDAFSIAFQPIIGLPEGQLAGVEALARIPGDPARAPDLWFAEAWEAGLGVQLELAAVREALRQLDDVPAGTYLSVNVSPSTVASPELEAMLCEVDASRILVEVTEHAVAQHYEELHAGMRRLRALGARFALDDVGAGYAGLNHLVRLGPEVIKLDRFLIQGIDADRGRQALVAAAVAFAERTHTRVIAEGIETAAEHAELNELGIRYGQGWHYARAMTLERACAVTG